MTHQRIPWSQYFMMQALVIAQRSTCDRALVGSVLVKDDRMIASGYNGSAKGQPHCDDVGHQMVDGHCVRTIHSEINALLQCATNGIVAKDAEIYVTHFPCYNCTKALIQAGVRKINYVYDYHANPLALELIEHVKLPVEKVAVDPTYLRELLQELTRGEQ